MILKKIGAKTIRDSRREKAIQVFIKTNKGEFRTSAPSGKSTGKYEVKPYFKNSTHDINYINNLDADKINKIINENLGSYVSSDKKNKREQRTDHPSKKFSINNSFKLLEKLELLIKNKIGANSLFSLEASLLKALAKENGQELFEFLSGKKLAGKNIKIRPVGNAIGGGLHSKGVKGKKPDFQEFLFIPKCKTFKESTKINELAYKIARKLLKAKNRNDEGAWETGKINEGVLNTIKKIQEIIKNKYKKQIGIGIDAASSSFYKNNYNYKNLKRKLNSKKQTAYINRLIRDYDLFYVEDPLNENDFSGFRNLLKKTKKISKNCLIVGDDLTTTNPERLKKAIKNKSINAIVVKPNQIGSLIKVKEVIDIAKKFKIKIIISHRSGETLDTTISDIAVAFQCDFIKTGIYGKEREAKLKRLINIERKLSQ
ncbi:MAG: enolase C-terminal domain-like protein [Nanoarchaeota archaeon]